MSDINIDKLAHLARLELTPEEKTKYAADLGAIIGYFDQLAKVEIPAGTKPSAHAFEVFADLREDSPGPVLDLADLKRNAPAWKDDSIVVPRVVDDGN